MTYDDIFPAGGVRPMGLVHVTGPSGVGKSMFAIGLISVGLDPSRVAVLDCEQSLRLHHESLHFGVYHDIVAETTAQFGIAGAPPRQVFRHILNCVQQLPDGLDLIIVDNVSLLEDGIEDEVETNPQKYGLTPGQVQSAGGLKWGPIKGLYRTFVQSLALKAKIYVFTSPLRQVWSASKPVPGLFRPVGKQDILEQLSFLRLWLTFSSIGLVEPDGLVLKNRLMKFERVEGGVRAVPLLPPKLVPCTWQRILDYFANPPDFENLQPYERLTEEDRARLTGTLTRDQLALLKLLSQEEPAPAVRAPQNLAEFISAVQGLGLTLQEALDRLGRTSISEVRPAEDFLALRGA